RPWITPRTPALERLPVGTSCDGGGPLRRHGDRSAFASSAPLMATPPKLVVVDMIAEHHVEADEKFSGERDSRLGPSAAVQDRKVPTTEVVIRTSRTRRGLSQHPAKGRVALLGGLAEPLLVSRCVDRGSQAHITDDVFAVRKALDGPENEDGGEGGHRTDAGMREQEPGVWIDRGHAGDVLVELVDASGEPAE